MGLDSPEILDVGRRHWGGGSIVLATKGDSMPVAEERGVTKAIAKVCPCEACKAGRKEPSKIAALAIHSYSSQPSGGWVKQMTYDERASVTTPTLFMGVELETSVGPDERRGLARRRAINAEVDRLHPRPPEPEEEYEYYDDPYYGRRRRQTAESERRYDAWRNERYAIDDQRYYTEERLWREGFGLPKPRGVAVKITAEEAVSLAEPVGFWHAKHDGSVSGPEFASLPATLDYWYGIRSDLDQMFTSLLHAGVRSHTGDTAGMHVSISVEAFADSEHLMRFAKLVNNNPRWSKRMSQRTEHSMSWCHLAQGAFSPTARPSSLRNWAENVMRYGESGGDRYNAINATCGGGRIEFRLPRGTLRIDRFYKNLEWVASMIEFTRQYAPTDSATYMRWVMSQGSRFGSLKAFLREKFGLNDLDAFEVPLAVTSAQAVFPAAGISAATAYCGCGDGCRAGDCGSCDDEYSEPEPDDYYDLDEDERCSCGLIHDSDISQYLPWSAPQYQHMHVNGQIVGERRQYRIDGTEYEYDEFGLRILTLGPAPEPAPDASAPQIAEYVSAYLNAMTLNPVRRPVVTPIGTDLNGD